MWTRGLSLLLLLVVVLAVGPVDAAACRVGRARMARAESHFGECRGKGQGVGPVVCVLGWGERVDVDEEKGKSTVCS